MEILRDFKKINKNDAGIAGGKGASLGEMTNASIPVPPGFVILASAFERFIEETDLSQEIDAILHKVNHNEIQSVDNASENIQKLIVEAKMPADIAKEIKKSFKKLDAEFVAVRSSATAEDSSSAAWAGQLDSFLNTTEKNLLEKVQHCWASLFTPRAIFYRFEKELHTTKISVAVVVQKMVESETSGIAFSVHPVTQDFNQLIIEGGFGLGEAIVSGQITPDSYVVEKEPRRIIDKNISSQERKLIRLIRENKRIRNAGKEEKSSGNEWIDVPVNEGEKQKLSDEEILELAELVLKIEKHYGFPCDIEWAREKGKFYITQSRPITTLTQKESNLDKKKDEFVWVENYSIEHCGYQLVSPMVEHGISEFQRIIFRKKTPSIFTEHFVDSRGLAFGGFYLEKEINEVIDRLTNLIYSKPEYILKNHKESYKINDAYVDFAKKCLTKDFSKMSGKQLAKIYIDLTLWQEKAHQHSLGSTWYVDSYGGTFANSVLEKTKALVTLRNSTLNPAEVFTILTTPEQASSGLKEELESLKILQKITKDKKASEIFRKLTDYSKIPENLSNPIKKAIFNHQDKWQWIPFGYLGPAYGIDYYLSVWAGLVRENIEVKKEIKRLTDRPKEIQRKKEKLIKVLDIPKDLQMIYKVAGDITFLKGYRKDSSYFGFFVVDKMFQEISKRINLPLLDTHLLLHLEIEDLLKSGKKADKKEIERRKKHAIIFLKNNKLTIISGEEADEFMKDKKIKKEEMVSGSDSWKGTCACSGSASGVVKIVNKPEEMSKMNQGDIMVSHTTFPSLVPAMKKASAIITEDGGITCHAAIVARELGTPCVTGIKVATKVLKDGDLVEVDADNGVVKIIKRHNG